MENETLEGAATVQGQNFVKRYIIKRNVCGSQQLSIFLPYQCPYFCLEYVDVSNFKCIHLSVASLTGLDMYVFFPSEASRTFSMSS